MTISWFCQWDRSKEANPALDPYDRQALAALLRGCPGLIEGHVFSPAQAHDPHYADLGGAPVLVLQLEFAEIADLENGLQAGGYLSCLADPHFLPSVAGAIASHQAMLTRRYPVAEPQPVATSTSPEGLLSYLVEYAGPAEDEQAWHRFYVGKHPHLLSKFPGIRGIEIYTPAVVISGLPFPFRTSMQRNKTVFDSADAMNAAMLSPVRDALRQDFHSFPPFTGEAAHYPFHTLSVRGGRAR
ncbi:hypothetical protein [Methylocella sp. CPCC 101449]|uniref:hypothetical protein n=1 Tax=Methylocella sp. CPCC 101449 TaxID=2987531 RepID=UPI00288F9472|nr:hypothetical protein [Methylocella sp. CPCC 101449]MDT2019588.1 hypothetical protein [Methylocella sp. CPCC 101449]